MFDVDVGTRVFFIFKMMKNKKETFSLSFTFDEKVYFKKF